MTQQEAKMKEFYEGKVWMIRLLRGKESNMLCRRVLRGHSLQKVGGKGSFKKCSSPFPLFQAFVEQKRRGGRVPVGNTKAERRKTEEKSPDSQQNLCSIMLSLRCLCWLFPLPR